MIDLHLRAEFERVVEPFVVKVRAATAGRDPREEEAVTWRRDDGSGILDCLSQFGRFALRAGADSGDLDGDVLLCVPARGVAHRLFRRRSRHNTLLLTERCDQLCVMCSQPPKNTSDEWRFPHYEKALLLTDKGATVGISGGEPTLYKMALFEMLARVSRVRPDLRYHILTNGQHFTSDDARALRDLHASASILWGVPLYSHRASTHDQVVGKSGAFEALMENLFLLGGTKARIEVRTVIVSLNALQLPNLADFVSKTLPFIADWAIMGMEPIGYALAHWDRLFFDHSIFPQPVINAVEISTLRGIPCHLYNLPRCTVPARYRRYCVDSISDWKKKYLPECSRCDERELCSGFFEWYNQKSSWEGISPIISKGGPDGREGVVHRSDTRGCGPAADADASG